MNDEEAMAVLTALRADFPDWKFTLTWGSDWIAQRTDDDGVTTIAVRRDPGMLRSKLRELSVRISQ
jgi:hypothetical protein